MGRKLRVVSTKCTAGAMQRKSHLCIILLGIARPQSQFPDSCVCERLIPRIGPHIFLQQNRQITKYLHIQSTEQCLASSELLTPQPLSTQRVYAPPAPKAGGGRAHTPLAVRGWGVNITISEDARHWIVLLQYNPSTRQINRGNI